MNEKLKERFVAAISKPIAVHPLPSGKRASYPCHLNESHGFSLEEIKAFQEGGFLGPERNNGFNCYSWKILEKGESLRIETIPSL